MLTVRNEPVTENHALETSLCVTKAWELGLDQAGRYVFWAPSQLPPRRVIVEAGFTRGEALGEFTAGEGDGRYPLQGLGIMLFVNWLAGYGDLILHSAGAIIEREGYCFCGASGAGKSTLAANLTASSGVTVLGEDQVILRFQNGAFWIYGTPWHLNPELCSPAGAPLKKLFFLDRTAEKTLAAIPPLEGITRLLQTAFVPYYRQETLPGILERLALLADTIPFFSLAYQLGADLLAQVHTA